MTQPNPRLTVSGKAARGLMSRNFAIPMESIRMLAEDWRKVNDGGHESQGQAFGRAAHDVGDEGLLTHTARRRDNG